MPLPSQDRPIVFQCGDAMQLLPTLPNGSVDLVLTDPPYGTTSCTWDKTPDWDALFSQLWRILKSNGAILMFAQNPLAAELIMNQKRAFRHEWIWEKHAAMGYLNVNKAPMRAHEIILVFAKSQYTYNSISIPHQSKEPYKIKDKGANHSPLFHAPQKTPVESKDGSRRPRDVVKYENRFPNKFHPTQKPLRLLTMLISQYTHPGETVLDPFAGSASTLKAAQIAGRRAIGFEMNRDYYERSCAWLGDRNFQYTPEQKPTDGQLTFHLH